LIRAIFFDFLRLIITTWNIYLRNKISRESERKSI